MPGSTALKDELPEEAKGQPEWEGHVTEAGVSWPRCCHLLEGERHLVRSDEA